MLCFLLVSLLYIAVFYAIGTVISSYLDSSKTALIVAFTVWVLAVLITPRIGFLTAKLIAPTGTEQSLYMEKTALRNNLNVEMQEKIQKKMAEMHRGDGPQVITSEGQGKLKELKAPIEEEYRLKFQNEANKIDRKYQRKQKRQEQFGETFSRLTPTSSLIYLAMNLTQTGKVKRNTYFQTGHQYYAQLDDVYFSNISDDQLAQIFRLADRLSQNSEAEKIPPPPDLTESSLVETLRYSSVDVLLLCFFAVALTTVAFLKFFRSDI